MKKNEHVDYTITIFLGTSIAFNILMFTLNSNFAFLHQLVMEKKSLYNPVWFRLCWFICQFLKRDRLVSFVLSPSPHPQLSLIDGCLSLNLVLSAIFFHVQREFFFPYHCRQVLAHWGGGGSSDYWGLCYIILGYLPYNIKHGQAIIVVMWCYISEAEFQVN